MRVGCRPILKKKFFSSVFAERNSETARGRLVRETFFSFLGFFGFFQNILNSEKKSETRQARGEEKLDFEERRKGRKPKREN
jgi:hypothetical protein